MSPKKAAPRKRKSAPAQIDEFAAVVKRGPGRPIDPTLPRQRVWMRLEDDEFAEWMAAADRLGVGISTWIRQTCNAAVRK